MSILTEAQAKAILDKVLALSKADECTASLTGSVDGNIRFALNNVSTSGIVSNTDLAVQVAFGKRTGVATINEFDDAALERVVRRAEDLARLAPENPEFMSAVEKQTYKPSPTFSESTAAITPEFRAQVAADSIAPCRGNGLIAADRAMRKTHVGRMSNASSDEVTVFRDDTLQAEDKAFFLKVRDVVEAAVSEATFQQIAEKMRQADRENSFLSRFGLPDISGEWRDQPDSSASSGLTRQIRSLSWPVATAKTLSFCSASISATAAGRAA